MPELTSRALAEFSMKPIVDQMRILAEQKRPNSGAAQYKVHYYHSTRVAIAKYFRGNNSPNIINQAVARLHASTVPDHKKSHNERAMRAFLNTTDISGRTLTPTTAVSVSTTLHGTSIRLYPDLTASENGCSKIVLFNFTIAPTDPELARRTLELSYWLHTIAGSTISPVALEYVDLQSNVVR